MKSLDESGNVLFSESTRRFIAGSMPQNGAALWIVWKSFLKSRAQRENPIEACD
jgi:hypothetical protein